MDIIGSRGQARLEWVWVGPRVLTCFWFVFFFPTCQLRIVRFQKIVFSFLPSLLPCFLPSFFSAPDLNSKHQIAGGSLGPQQQASECSGQSRTSTTTNTTGQYTTNKAHPQAQPETHNTQYTTNNAQPQTHNTQPTAHNHKNTTNKTLPTSTHHYTHQTHSHKHNHKHSH